MKGKKLKEKKLYVNKYYFYAVNVWVLFWGGITILSYLVCQLWLLGLNNKQAKSIGVIGGADGATAIYLASSGIPPLSEFILNILIILGMFSIWVITYKKYQKAKEEVKEVSLKMSLGCGLLAMAVLGISGNTVLTLIPLSLAMILIILWNGKKFDSKK